MGYHLRTYSTSSSSFLLLSLVCTLDAAAAAAAACSCLLAMEISVLHIYNVVPNQPTPKHRLFLSAFDLQFITLPFNPQRILFYSPPPPLHPAAHSFYEIASRLRHSLSSVLVHFYPLAGRLAPAEDHSCRLEIDCNDAGVEFVEAVANCSLYELGDLCAETLNNDVFTVLGIRQKDCFHDLNDQPLLIVQVTKFDCGGFSISCSFNHVVADGHSFWHFMKSWSEVCRGEALSLEPYHHRLSLNMNHCQSPRVSQLTDKNIGGSQTLSRPPKNAFFHISKAALARLKQLGNDRHEKHPLSSFETLCAHFWLSITRARLLHDEDETKMYITVNCRKRLNPPLPDAYFGNAITMVCSTAKAIELTRNGITYAGRLAHYAISSCDNEAIIDKLELSEKRGNCSCWSISPNDLVVGSSPRFPLYETDFAWGNPTAVRRLHLWEQGFMVVDPAAEGEGSVDVSLGLEPEVVDRLLADPEFIDLLGISNVGQS